MRTKKVILPNRDMYNVVTMNFREAMIQELAANFDKGDREGKDGWLKITYKQLLNEIYYHTGKLQEAVRNNDVPRIKEYAADVANLALMCYDKISPLAPINAYPRPFVVVPINTLKITNVKKVKK